MMMEMYDIYIKIYNKICSYVMLMYCLFKAAPGAPQAQAQWMPRPQGIAGCPPGLEYLTQIDQLLVQQKVELMEGNYIHIGQIKVTKAD